MANVPVLDSDCTISGVSRLRRFRALRRWRHNDKVTVEREDTTHCIKRTDQTSAHAAFPLQGARENTSSTQLA